MRINRDREGGHATGGGDSENRSRARRLLIDIARRRQRAGTGSIVAAGERRPMVPAPDLETILSGLPWAVAGAVATRLYMPERATVDIDVVVPFPMIEQARSRLVDAGFRHLGALTRSPEGNVVDLIKGHESWWPQAISEAAGNRNEEGWPVLTLPYLGLMKLLAGRVQDLADVTRMLGGAGDEALARVREVISGLASDLLEDVESLIALGKLEARQSGADQAEPAP